MEHSAIWVADRHEERRESADEIVSRETERNV